MYGLRPSPAPASWHTLGSTALSPNTLEKISEAKLVTLRKIFMNRRTLYNGHYFEVQMVSAIEMFHYMIKCFRPWKGKSHITIFIG